MASTNSGRGIAPVIGTILVVGVTVILASTTAVFALGVTDAATTAAPTVALDTEYDTESDTIVVRHRGGETIAGERIEITGAESATVPEELQAGETIVAEPADDADEVLVTWKSVENSAILTSVAVDGDGAAAGPGSFVTIAGDDLDGDRDDVLESQCEAGEVTQAELDDPFTVEIDLDEPVTEDVSLAVSVRDSYDTCGDAPADTLSGTEEVAFEDGTGSFTIESPETDEGADFTLIGWFVSDVEQIDGVYVEVDDETDAAVTELRVNV